VVESTRLPSITVRSGARPGTDELVSAVAPLPSALPIPAQAVNVLGALVGGHRKARSVMRNATFCDPQRLVHSS
jgi:hypothetical protein